MSQCIKMSVFFCNPRGARHGHTMSAKLARLEQQEQEFMVKYGKKKQTGKTTQLSEETFTEVSSPLDQERAEKTERKKAKRKKLHSDESKEDGIQDNTAASQEHREATSKKRKKQPKHRADLESEDVADPFVDTDTKKKRQKIRLLPEDESTEIVQEGEVAETAEIQSTDESISKKKRKKQKNPDKSSALEKGLGKNAVLSSEESAQSTESYEHKQQEEGATALHSILDVAKKKKKKSSKANKDKSPAQEMDSCYSLDSGTAENVEAADAVTDSLQLKKRKSRKDEPETELTPRLLDKPNEKKKKKKKDAK